MSNLGPGVGFESQPKKVSWTKRDVLLYNVSIGCTMQEPQFVYEKHDEFSVFPTYPLALVFKLDHKDVIDFYASQNSTKIPSVPELDPSRLVDGQRAIELLKPLPVTSESRDFEVRSKVLGVYDKGKAGTIVKSEDSLVDCATGEVFARIIGSLFYVGQGGWGGPRGPKELPFPAIKRDPDQVLRFQVQENSAHLYRLNGDYNPLHATKEFGIQMGFGGIIVHGVYAYSRIAHDLIQVLGNSRPESLKEFRAKFAGPVRPGDTIETSLWRTGPQKDGWQETRWIAKVVETGKVCLSDGIAVIQASDSRMAKL